MDMFASELSLTTPQNLVVGTIFNHSSYRHAILQTDFLRLKDRWPTNSTTSEPDLRLEFAKQALT